MPGVRDDSGWSPGGPQAARVPPPSSEPSRGVYRSLNRGTAVAAPPDMLDRWCDFRRRRRSDVRQQSLGIKSDHHAAERARRKRKWKRVVQLFRRGDSDSARLLAKLRGVKALNDLFAAMGYPNRVNARRCAGELRVQR
jgi:hypothetical protein